MAVAAIEWAFEQNVPVPSAKLVLLSLADHADKHGHCWPSITRISQRTGLSRATIFRSIETLCNLGLVQQTFDEGKVNQYNLAIPVSSCDGLADETRLTMRPDPSHHETPPVSSCDGTRLTMRPEPSVTVKEPPKKRERAHAISEDWAPDDALLTWASERTPHVDHAIETEKFINYYLSKGETRKDWKASWRNWMLRATRDYSPGPIRLGTRSDQRRARNLERIDAAMARRSGSGVQTGDDDTGLRPVPALRLVTGGAPVD